MHLLRRFAKLGLLVVLGSFMAGCFFPHHGWGHGERGNGDRGGYSDRESSDRGGYSNRR